MITICAGFYIRSEGCDIIKTAYSILFPLLFLFHDPRPILANKPEQFWGSTCLKGNPVSTTFCMQHTILYFCAKLK